MDFAKPPSAGCLIACLLAALALWAAPAALAAEGEQVLSLNQAIQKALNYSPNLQATKEDLQGAQASRYESLTGFLPTFKTNYTYTDLQHVVHTRSPLGYTASGTLAMYQWTNSVSQPLFTGFNLLSTFRLADLGVDVAQIQVRLTMLDLVLQVKETYFNFLLAQKTEEVTRQAVEQLSSHLQTAKDFYDVGIIPLNDVLKSEVELANSRQDEVRAQNATALARAQLGSLLGLSVDTRLEVQDILKHHPVDLEYDQARRVARLERPELTSLEYKLRQADQSIHQAQSRYYPQLSLVASYIFTSDRPELGQSSYYDPTQAEVVTQLDWTFWEWGRTYAQVSQRRAQKRHLENTLRDMQDQVDLQVKQYYLDLQESQRNIVTAQAAIRSAVENYRITEERFKEQLTTNTEVLDAQTLLSQARNNLNTALTQYNVSEARLRRAMGNGVPEGVEPPREAVETRRRDPNPLAGALAAPPPEKP